ncbi:MAG TPA: hypothetical protein PLS87_11265 [Ferruginibacter sp.]|nr:hypothetical protein [Ferruginibacter sp.]HRO97646.1 hypothetical protein [Ferruginibacter sp.]
MKKTRFPDELKRFDGDGPDAPEAPQTETAESTDPGGDETAAD